MQAYFISKKKSVLDEKALLLFLTYQFVPKPAALLKPALKEKLSGYPGEYPVPAMRESMRNTGERTFYRMFLKTVNKLLPAGRQPIGLLLSGGVDSSALLHAVRECTDRKIHTITAVFDKRSLHGRYSYRLARRYGTEHTTLPISSRSLGRLADVYSGGKKSSPMGDNELLPLYLMFEELKETVRHVFTGAGADHILGGVATERKVSAASAGKNGDLQVCKLFLRQEAVERVLGKKVDIDLLAPLRRALRQIPITDPVKKTVMFDINFLMKNRYCYDWLPESCSGMVPCAPYLDTEFVGFCLRLPGASLKGKAILRRTFQTVLPEEIMSAKKKGLSPPFQKWYFDNFPLLKDCFIECARLGISTGYIKEIYRDLKYADTYVVGMRVWILLNLAFWSRGMRHPQT